MPVQFYDPGGKIAAAARAQQVLGPRSAAKPAKPQPTQHGSVYEYGLRMAAKAPIAAAPVKEEEKPSGAGGILGRGLGMVLNNPVAKTILRPLDVLDVPRRAVWSTINEAADAVNGGDASIQDWYDQTNPFHAITQRGDPSFGAGTVLPDVDTPFGAGVDKWINRGIGLAGDIAADPLTYIDGIGFVADAAKVSRELEKLSDAQRAIKPLVELEEKAARFGLTPDVMPANVAGAAERAAALGGTEELERLGRRSLTGTNPVQREVMNIPEPGIGVKLPFTKMEPRIIPGTATIGEAGAGLKAGIKETVRGFPGMERIREMRAPVGVSGNPLHPAFERILTGRGGGSIQGAIDTIGIDNQARLAAGKFSRVAADELNRVAEETKHLTPEQNADLIRMAEENPEVENIWTQYQQTVNDVGQWAGVDIPQMQGGRYVMPHVLDRGFRNHLMKLAKANDPRATSFMRESGLTMDDLLEEGGFMQRRQWRPNEDGSPFKVDIGGQKFEIETGSINELNEKLSVAFPDYKGRIYEIDPTLAWRGYIQGTSKDVAKRFAFEDAARRGREGVERRTPQPQQFDPYGGRVDLPPRQGPNGEDIPVQRVTANPPNVLTPEEARFYRPSTTNDSAVAATKARNKLIKKTQPQLLDEYRSAAQARRYEIAEELEQHTEELLGPISASRNRALSLRNNAATTRDVAAGEIDELTNVARPALQAQMDEIDAELKRLASARSGVARTARERTRRRQDELLDRVDEKRRALIAERDSLAEVYRQRHGDVRNAAEQTLEQVRNAAPGAKRSIIAKHQKELETSRDRAQSALSNKRYELQRKWKARAEFRDSRNSFRGKGVTDVSGTSERDVAVANRFLQENEDAVRRFVADEDALLDARREFHGKNNVDALDEAIAREHSEIKRLNPKGADLDGRIDYINKLMRERQAMVSARRHLEPVMAQLERNLNQPQMKRIADALQIRTNNRRWKEYIEREASTEHSRVVEMQRQLDAWEQGVKTDAEVPFTAVNETPTAAASPEVAQAQAYLETNAAQKYVQDRTRMQNLTESFIKGSRSPDTAEVGRLKREIEEATTATAKRKLNAELKKAEKAVAADTAEIQRVLREERDALRVSLERRKVTGRKVEKAEQEIKAATPTPAAATTVAPQQHPVLAEANRAQGRAERQAQRDVNDLTQRQTEITAEMLPPIREAEAGVAESSAQIRDIARGIDPETNQIAMDEGMAAIEKRRGLSDQAEVEKLKKGELTAVQQRIDEETGAFQTIYNEAVTDEAKYRAQHREIADKADANRVLRAKDRSEMVPSNRDLEKVEAGQLPSHNAQPLQRTVDDLNKVIAANPNGDDALMSRMEAALMPYEQKLAELTKELDLPAREVEKIITAARKGELAPVISYIMKSNWRQVWTGGDVVISKELDSAYKLLTSALDNPGEFSRVLTAYTNFFKTYATLTPGFHVRNGLSAIFMNTVDGVSLGNQFDGVKLWREYAKSDRPLAWLLEQDQQTQDAFSAVFSSGAGGRYNEAGFAKSSSTGRRRQTLFNNRLTRLSQRVGQDWTEGPVRLGMALDSVRSGQNVTDAMGRITRIHFDYGQVSQFDEKAKRLIPFWTFMSRNLPMQITEMWSKPKVYAWYNSFVRNTKGEDVENTPDYFGQLGAYPFADMKVAGMPVFLQPDLGHVRVQTDLSDLENALSGENLMRPLTNINPLFTALPEYIGERDLYTGQQFDETDVRKLGPLEKLGQPVLSALGLTKTAPDGTQLVEERLPNFLQAINPLYARSASLMPGLTTGADDDTQRQLEAWLRTGLGVPARTLSPAQQKNAQRSEFFKARDDKRLQDAMARAAAGG